MNIIYGLCTLIGAAVLATGVLILISFLLEALVKAFTKKKFDVVESRIKQLEQDFYKEAK